MPSELLLRGWTPYQGIEAEHLKRDAQGKRQDLPNERWLALITEELGEAAEAVLEADPVLERKHPREACIDNLEYELIQIATLCVEWIECLHRNHYGKGDRQ